MFVYQFSGRAAVGWGICTVLIIVCSVLEFMLLTGPEDPWTVFDRPSIYRVSVLSCINVCTYARMHAHRQQPPTPHGGMDEKGRGCGDARQSNRVRWMCQHDTRIRSDCLFSSYRSRARALFSFFVRNVANVTSWYPNIDSFEPTRYSAALTDVPFDEILYSTSESSAPVVLHVSRGLSTPGKSRFRMLLLY